MICDEFRRLEHGDAMSPEAIAHLRACADCLDGAAADDPMNLFRAIGGSGVEPADGVESFVSDVMQEVRLRDAERRLAAPRRRRLSVPWAIAAALVLAIASGLVVFRPDPSPAPGMTLQVAASVVSSEPEPIVPVVETWAAADATIVEVPMQPEDDIRVVMVFDDSLPVDL